MFPSEDDSWLGVLRIGIGAQLVAFCLSLRHDWTYLLAPSGEGLISRQLAEALMRFESQLIPRIDWIASVTGMLGISDATLLWIVWWLLLAAGIFLVAGLFCRTAAILAWFLHLCAVKSGDLVAYGVDNFTTIALFYLMLSPLPGRWSIDQIRRAVSAKPQLLGFFRRVLQLHLCIAYFFGGLAKCLGSGWWDGTNLWRSLIQPPFRTLDPELIMRAEPLLPLAGASICLLELSYPVWIWNRRTRASCLICVIVMHAAIAVTMGMYLFSFVMIVLNVAAFGSTSLTGRSEAGVIHASTGAINT